MRYILAGFLFCGLISCGNIKPQEASVYFSLDSLLDLQSDHLVASKAKLTKITFSAKDSAFAELNPDSLGWSNEFQLIRELDINKPSLSGRYKQIKKKDTNSNLDVIRYESTEDDLDVEYFELYYLKELKELKLIKASSFESNSIFKSSKNIELELDNINDKLQITRYNVKGYQKMILQDSVKFRIEGKITY